MSKWGIEEKETLEAIDKIKFNGNILNLACGDGRFNHKLLEIASHVVAVDYDMNELQLLEKACPNKLKNKLSTKKVDICSRLPFSNGIFDGVFCTGTLHLFEKEKVTQILNEIKRVLKNNGKIVLDFATDIERFNQKGEIFLFFKNN